MGYWYGRLRHQEQRGGLGLDMAYLSDHFGVQIRLETEENDVSYSH